MRQSLVKRLLKLVNCAIRLQASLPIIVRSKTRGTPRTSFFCNCASTRGKKGIQGCEKFGSLCMCHQSLLKSPNLLSIPYLAWLNKPPARVNHEWRSSKPERPTPLLHRGTRGVLPCFKPECMLNSHKKNALITILSNFDGDLVYAIRFIARSM